MFNKRSILLLGISGLTIFSLIVIVSSISGTSFVDVLYNQTTTADKATYDANVQASVEALMYTAVSTLTIEEAVSATIAALTPASSPTGIPFDLTSTYETDLIQTYFFEDWGPGTGEVVDNRGKTAFGIEDITIHFSRIGDGRMSGTMSWTALFPKPGLDGIGRRKDEVRFIGRYYLSISEIEDIEFWDLINGWDEEDITIWLEIKRTSILEGIPNLSNITLAVINEDGQMKGATYDPERDDAHIFDFTIWPSE